MVVIVIERNLKQILEQPTTYDVVKLIVVVARQEGPLRARHRDLHMFFYRLSREEGYEDLLGLDDFRCQPNPVSESLGQILALFLWPDAEGEAEIYYSGAPDPAAERGEQAPELVVNPNAETRVRKSVFSGDQFRAIVRAGRKLRYFLETGTYLADSELDAPAPPGE